jgi:predicted ester cyclase
MEERAMPFRMHQLIAAILFLGTTVLLSACSSPESTTPAKGEPKVITAEERVQWYRACWGQFNDARWDQFKTCYADNATSQQMAYGPPSVSGADAIVARSRDFKKLAPDGHGEGQLILVNGNHIASAFLLAGTNSGPLTGPDGKETKATNKKFGLMFGHALELDPAANKVVKEFGVMDGGSFANQLGLSKAPGRPLMEKGAATPVIVIANDDDKEMKNLETDKAGFAAWNSHDLAGADAPNADDFVLHDMTSPKDMNKAQNSEMGKSFWKAFSDVKLDITSAWAAGDYVALTGSLQGTNDGDFPAMKIKKTGKKVAVPFMQIDRFESGKIKETWLFFDGAMLASQLMPAPAK